jgi:sortase (surface protein transpeptidase)
MKMSIPTITFQKVLSSCIIFVLGFVFTTALLHQVAPRSSRTHPTPAPALIVGSTTIKPHEVVSYDEAPAIAEAPREKIAYTTPVRIKIPKLKIDARINSMGLTTKGDMEAPTRPQDVGWYKFGTRPGEQGNAVMAGHYGNGSSRGLSIFDNLHTLSKNDTIYTEDEKGTVVTFVVSKMQTYAWNDVVAEVFEPADEQAHLNLITCQGVWDKARQTYTQRLVLFATKV